MWGINLSGVKKGQLRWMVMLLLAGVVLLTAGRFTGGGPNKAAAPPLAVGPVERSGETGIQQTGITGQEAAMEQRLANILGRVQGVGNVSVRVFLASGPEFEYAANLSTSQRKVDEKDQSGGLRVTTESENDGQLVLVQGGSGGVERPVVTKETMPRVQGVLVVAEGATDPRVKLNIIRALETVLDIEPHKISVLPGR